MIALISCRVNQTFGRICSYKTKKIYSLHNRNICHEHVNTCLLNMDFLNRSFSQFCTIVAVQTDTQTVAPANEVCRCSHCKLGRFALLPEWNDCRRRPRRPRRRCCCCRFGPIMVTFLSITNWCIHCEHEHE